MCWIESAPSSGETGSGAKLLFSRQFEDENDLTETVKACLKFEPPDPVVLNPELPGTDIRPVSLFVVNDERRTVGTKNTSVSAPIL